MSKNKEDEFIERLTEQEICELHEAFNIFDVESDGSITVNQLVMLMKALKQSLNKNELEVNNISCEVFHGRYFSLAIELSP